MQYKIKKEVYDKQFGFAYRWTCLFTTFCFILVVAIYLNPEFIVDELKLEMQGEFKATSLAIASIIMIMYNYFAWVEFTQNMSDDTQFADLDNVMDRASLLMSELDHVCDYCTTLRQVSSTQTQGQDSSGIPEPNEAFVNSKVKLLNYEDKQVIFDVCISFMKEQ